MSNDKACFETNLQTLYPALNLGKMSNGYHEYKVAFHELTENGTKSVTVTDFHKFVGGQFRYASFAYDYFLNSFDKDQRETLPRPGWFDLYLDKVQVHLEATWQEIEVHISNAIAEKSSQFEDLKRSLSDKNEAQVEYIDELSDQLRKKTDTCNALEQRYVDFTEMTTLSQAKLESTNQHLSEQVAELKQTITLLHSEIEQLQLSMRESLVIEGQYKQLKADYHVLFQKLTDSLDGSLFIEASSESCNEENPF
ncbi:hypothetical protein DLI08_17450 [Vibrio parahaemolyticus]|nr:hypothetical protein [Vibrio parahaemolyticus]EGX6075363.1 hypothetical protein [Vibrio parahaemolyticus]EKG9563497.1 hypothetical protein [Vibrio parahaemolyticus]EKG9663042.1 hypothetical protein [Vibrio parahaemolyticus]EKG9668527.1 hypothetical protein [Vibrio parahaemolyticus]